jgi:VanZ family protein
VKEKWKNLILRWGPALLMMALIFAASSLPSGQVPSFGLWDVLVKKGSHMAGFGLLAVAYLHALANGRRVSVQRGLLAVAGAGLYALTDEYHQSFVGGRHPSLADVLIDTGGAAAAAALAALIQTRARPGRPRPPSIPR